MQLAKLEGSSGRDFGGSVAISGSIAVVGDQGAYSGRAYVFSQTAKGWELGAELKSAASAPHEYFGTSVAISGTTIVVGAPGYHPKGPTSSSGQADVFTKTATGWAQTAVLTGSDSLGDFGESVAISGTTIVVSAGFAEQAGQDYVFTKTASGWEQTAVLGTGGYGTGGGVAISGTTIVAGGYNDHGGISHAYVFSKTANGWKQAATLLNSGAVPFDDFGSAVAISGNLVVVGARAANGSYGGAYIFSKRANGWQQTAELQSSVSGDYFGSSVAVSGASVVIGAPGVGLAYLFVETQTGWEQLAQLRGSTSALGDSVAISGAVAVCGAPAESGGVAGNTGRAYMFEAYPGLQLDPGQSLSSPDGRLRLVMQLDGNLVLYTPTGHAAWASNTRGHTGVYALMQLDGNLVLYEPSGRALWATATEGHPGAYLAVQNDGNLVVYSSVGWPLWATNTRNAT